MYIEKTTMSERGTISDAMTPIFVNLERAETLLATVQDECFEHKRGNVYISADAKWLYDMISIVEDILCDAITAFYLTTADTPSNSAAQCYLSCAKNAETAMRCGEIFDRI